MADIQITEEAFRIGVRCPSCLKSMTWLSHGADSRIRGHWSSPCQQTRISAGQAGTSGPAIAAFAQEHAACPPREVVESVSPGGLTIRDWRGR